MPEFTVYFSQHASAAVDGVVAESTDEAIEEAYQGLPGPLCHQCAREYELAGDWEPEAVVDGSGNEWWTRRGKDYS